MPTRTLYAAVVLFFLAVTGSGCGASTDAPPPDLTDNYSDALRASTTISSGTVITYISAYFAAAANVSMRTLSATQASTQVVTAVQQRVAADFANPSCVTADTDGNSFVALTFANCTGAHGKLALKGSVRADVSMETKPCGPDSCPVAVLYTITTTDLVIDSSSVTGNWTIRDPLATDQPYTWVGLLDFVTPERGVTFSGSASFTYSTDCVDMSNDSMLGGSGQRSLSFSADHVLRCMGACPTGGSVLLTNEQGATLAWTYDGAPATEVSTVGGAKFNLGLTCTQ